MGSTVPDMRFVRHVAKDSTINRIALAVERAFSEEHDIGLDELSRLLPTSTFIRVSRRAESSLFVTDDLLRRRNKFALTVVGYDTSFTAGCIEAHDLIQSETTFNKPVIVSAQPIICRGIGIGAIILGTTAQLDVHQQEFLASLADALAGVLDDMVLSENMKQLLAWRERDQSFCGRELEYQDLPCLDTTTSLRSLRPTRDGSRVSFDEGASKPVNASGCSAWEETRTPTTASGEVSVATCSKASGRHGKEKMGETVELPDEFNIRIFGLSWLYLSAVIVGKMFLEGNLPVVPAVVAILALVSGAGSLVVLFPGMRKQLLGTQVNPAVEKGFVQCSKLTTAAAMVVAATNALAADSNT
jgi:hypothetical protein